MSKNGPKEKWGINKAKSEEQVCRRLETQQQQALQQQTLIPTKAKIKTQGQKDWLDGWVCISICYK